MDAGVNEKRSIGVGGCVGEEQQPFSLKYRPHYLRDLTDDPAFLRTVQLLQAMEDLNVMFVGSPKVGKTMLLYALVYEYYGLQPNHKLPENNILFINNLRDNGIHYFRNEMKTFSQTHSTVFGKKKMIVIDDIDWVNEQCQQVIRNYLDKYASNILFLCVCTNPHKVIESIQSRLHVVEIPPMQDAYILARVRKIIHAENIRIHEDAVAHLLLYGRHSIRNIMNYLEKMLILDIPITLEVCHKTYLHVSVDKFDKYLCALKRDRDITAALKILFSIAEHGFSVIDIYDFFFSFLKQAPLPLLQEQEKYEIIKCLCFYIQQFNVLHEDHIELVFLTKRIYDILHPTPTSA